MYCAILCDELETRLWPLSHKNFSKQSINSYPTKSLLQETFLRMQHVMPAEQIYFVTNHTGYSNVFNQIKEIFPELRPEQIVTKPIDSSTAPIIALTTKYLLEKEGVAKNDPIIFLPADQIIVKTNVFLKLVRAAMHKVANNIGTIGVTPNSPAIDYDYLKKGKMNSGRFQVIQFKEKPDKKTAEGYISTRQYVWNSGIYIFTESTFAQELAKYAPNIFAEYAKTFEELEQNFKNLPSISIEHAILEKSDKVITFEGNFGSNDIS